MNITLSGKITIDGSEYDLDVRLRQTRELLKRAAQNPAKPTTSARLLKVAEAASILGVCRSRVYEMLQRNEIPGRVKLGRSTRINSEVLQRWIHERAEQEERR